ncbi:MAG: hypothetical protein V4642_13505 [Bacteroidota bacterium]
MKYNVILTANFKREVKKLLKRYSSLRNELFELEQELTANPTIGTDLGNNSFKIRIAIKSKGKGKRGGGRVITYVITEDWEVYLLSIYDKSDFDIIDDKILKNLIAEIKADKK